jgi:ABC-type nitrate/sulfonate/bicarbonate transport system ATPase subunit
LGKLSDPQRDRSFDFHAYSLFEWMTVEHNICFALEKTAYSRTEKNKLVTHFVHAVGLTGFETAYGSALISIF